MREIELRTAAQDFVAVVEIAPFPDAGLPEVVIWGSRTFVRARDRGTFANRVVYVEGLAVRSVTPPPGLPVS